ncbi:MAG: hypothetical protein H6921_14985 [Sphingomonas sp.]|jgi:hypothetical protein|nr:hypothetical protein [Sphingomonas sp.]
MKGAFSNSPAPSCVRLLVGSQLLFLVVAWLVLASRSGIGAGLAGLVILVSAIGIASLLAAIMGEPAVSAGPGRRRLGHGR